MYRCKACSTDCDDNLIVHDVDGDHFYCRGILCQTLFKDHHIQALHRRLEAGFACSHEEVEGLGPCGSPSDPDGTFKAGMGRCKKHKHKKKPAHADMPDTRLSVS